MFRNWFTRRSLQVLFHGLKLACAHSIRTQGFGDQPVGKLNHADRTVEMMCGFRTLQCIRDSCDVLGTSSVGRIKQVAAKQAPSYHCRRPWGKLLGVAPGQASGCPLGNATLAWVIVP